MTNRSSRWVGAVACCCKRACCCQGHPVSGNTRSVYQTDPSREYAAACTSDQPPSHPITGFCAVLRQEGAAKTQYVTATGQPGGAYHRNCLSTCRIQRKSAPRCPGATCTQHWRKALLVRDAQTKLAREQCTFERLRLTTPRRGRTCPIYTGRSPRAVQPTL